VKPESTEILLEVTVCFVVLDNFVQAVMLLTFVNYALLVTIKVKRGKDPAFRAHLEHLIFL
jgi:hypothetical protein